MRVVDDLVLGGIDIDARRRRAHVERIVEDLARPSGGLVLPCQRRPRGRRAGGDQHDGVDDEAHEPVARDGVLDHGGFDPDPGDGGPAVEY